MSPEVRASYTDSFAHAFDGKGRITVPSEWRQEGFESSLFILPSNKDCVRVYPSAWMSRLQEKISTMKTGDTHRLIAENLATSAQSATFDSQGRMLVKEKLRESAGLEAGKPAMLVGRLDRFEIWNKAAWEKLRTAAVTVEDALDAIGL